MSDFWHVSASLAVKARKIATIYICGPRLRRWFFASVHETWI